MNKRYAMGLVVGKFCPLHRGHQRVIDHAFSACDEVIVISYTKPGFARYGAALREQWLAMLAPAATRLVVDDDRLAAICRHQGIEPQPLPHDDDADETHRSFVGWLCDTVIGKTVDAVFTSESYGPGFAASLQRRWQADVTHVAVDPQRTHVPISGTTIRSDPQRYRSFIDPRVAADLVPRVALLGGESSGKTTLARALAQHLGTVWVQEYGRALWERRCGALQFSDLLDIAQTQVVHEQALALQAKGWLVCDTTPLTTQFYSQAMFGRVDPALESLAARPYDLIALCVRDFAFVQDGTRQDAAFSDRQHQWYQDELRQRQLACIAVAGPVADRVGTVMAGLKASGL